MITKEEIQELLHSTETFRVERTTSTGAHVGACSVSSDGKIQSAE